MRITLLIGVLGIQYTACRTSLSDPPLSEAKQVQNGCNGGATAYVLPSEYYNTTEVPDRCAMQWARKGHSIEQYIPSQTMMNLAYSKFQQMNAAAQPHGYKYVIQGPNSTSGYRDYKTQGDVFNGWMVSSFCAGKDDKEKCAMAFSAKPGTSEHQLGMAFDISAGGLEPFNTPTGASPFGTSCAGQWMRENAHNFGFSMSYPWGLEALHCYDPEPWHWRYVGKTLATRLYNESAARGKPYPLEMLFRDISNVIPPALHCPDNKPLYNYNHYAETPCRHRQPTTPTTPTNPNDEAALAAKCSATNQYVTCIAGTNYACLGSKLLKCYGACFAEPNNGLNYFHDICLASDAVRDPACEPNWGKWTTCLQSTNGKEACVGGRRVGCSVGCVDPGSPAPGQTQYHDRCDNGQ